MSNPAWAVQPPTQQPASQPVAQPAQTAVTAVQPAKAPANPAYSDDRYSDYFRRFPTASGTVSTTPVPTATAPATQAPVANPVVAAAPQVNSAPLTAGMPQYNSPPASPVHYNSPAVAQTTAGIAPPQQNYSISPTGSFAWPATPAPAMTAAAATQPYTGAPIAGSPSGTLTGVTASAPAATQAASTTPPVGLDGYCPVTLADQKRWQVGDRRYGVIHRGRTYLFAGPVEQQKFLSNPDHYSPAISGQDVVMALDQGQPVDGQRQFGVQYQGRTYLFASDASRCAFSQNPKRYAAEVLQAENPNRPPLR